MSTVGNGLLTGLTDTGADEVWFRPHPLAGTNDGAERAALNRLLRLCSETDGIRYVDPNSEPATETMAHASVLVTDISSLLVDFYAFDRPVVVVDVDNVV